MIRTVLRLITTLAFKAVTDAATKAGIEEAKEKLAPKIEEAKEKLGPKIEEAKLTFPR